MKSAISVLRRWIDLDRQLVRGGVKLDDFAAQWKVSYSTVLRDLRAFRELGQVVIEWRGSGRYGSIGEYGYDGSPPLFLCNVHAAKSPFQRAVEGGLTGQGVGEGR